MRLIQHYLKRQQRPKKTLDDSLIEINKNLQDKLSKAEKTFSTSMTQINKDLDEQLKTLKSTFETTMETVP